MQLTESTLTEPNTARLQGRLPDFFILGAAKCGTTTLYKYLCRHPNIFMSDPKEMSFFSKDEVFEKGFPWYTELFSGAREDQLCGEASTTYTRWPLYPQTVERIHASCPEARLIYIVRNPVDRLYSFYAHRMREHVTSTFSQFLEQTPEAVDSGRFMTQINQFLERFHQEQLLVLFNYDLLHQPAVTLSRAAVHLGLPEFDFLAAGPIRANEGGGKFYASSSLTKTIHTLKRVPAVNSLLKCVPAETRKAGYEWLADGPIGKRLRRRHQRRLCSLTPALRAELFEIYREEINHLQEFTGRDLSHWLVQDD